MKKKALTKNVLLLMTFFLSITISAQSEQSSFIHLSSDENINSTINRSNQLKVFSQESDKVQILKECLDILELQQYLAKNSDGSYSPIHIMQYPITFSDSINLTKFDEPVIFQSRQEIDSNEIKTYFIFKVLSIESDNAQVEFDYYDNTAEPQLIEISTNLKKTESKWEIVDSKTNKK